MKLCLDKRVNRTWLAGLGVALAVVGALVLPVTSATPAHASTGLQIRSSLGYRVNHGRDFVGAYRLANGRLIYCIDPDYAEPHTVALSTKSRLPRLSPTATAEVSELLFAHGHATTKWQAAVVSQAANTLIGNKKAVARRAHLLPTSVGKRATLYVAEARRFHGPYRVRVSSRRPCCRVSRRAARSACRRRGPASPAPVQFGECGGLARRADRPARYGGVHDRGQRAGRGPHRRAGDESGADDMLASDPKGRVQRMISWRPAVSNVASASFERRASGFAHSMVCSSTCNGHPVTTLRACVASSTQWQRVIYRYAGHVKVLTWA